MTSSKALRTVSPPNPESKTPILGESAEERPELRERLPFIHFVPGIRPIRLNVFQPFRHIIERRFDSTARPRRYWRPMRARSRMPQKSANLLCRFRRKNVLELASLLLDLRLALERQTVGKQPLGQAMPPNNVSSSLASPRSQFHNHASVAHGKPRRLQRVVARIHERLVIVRFRRMRRSLDQPHLPHLVHRQAHWQRAVNFHVLDLSNLALFLHHPQLFQHFLKLLFVRHGEYFLRRNLSVVQLNAAITQSRDYRI